MEVKQPQEVIRGRYTVIHTFSFNHRLLYLAKIRDEENTLEDTYLVHAVELKKELSPQELQTVKARNEDWFIPAIDTFVENGVFYQVFPFVGNLLGLHLLKLAPFPLEEVKGIIKQITSHLMQLYDDGQFGVVDPLNLMIEEGNRVRFVYGGPSTLLENPGASKDPELMESEDVFQVAKLMYLLLTRDQTDPQSITVQYLREKIPALPLELESILMRAFSPDPYRRPHMREIWKWIHETGDTRKQEVLVDDTLTKNTKLASFGLDDPKPDTSKKAQKKAKETKKKATAAKKPFFTTTNILMMIALVAVVLLVRDFLSGNEARSLAAELIDESIEEDPTQAQNFAEEADAADKKGDLNAAITSMKKAISADPENPEYYIKLATYHGAQKKYKEGARILEIASQIFTEDDMIWDHLGVYYYHNKEYEKALDAVNKAIELKSSEGNYYYHQGKIYKALNKKEDAFKAFLKVAEKDANNASGYHELAVYSFTSDDLDKAIEYGKEAVNINGANYDMWITLGTLYMEKSEKLKGENLPADEKKKQMKDLLNQAYAQFNRATNMDPENPHGYYMKSRLHFLNGTYLNALTSASNALKLNSNEPEYFYQAAISAIQCHKDPYPEVSHCQNGEYKPKEPYKKLAIQYAQRAVRLDPDNSTYLEALKQAEQLKDEKGGTDQ